MALTISATDTEVQKPVNVIYNQMLLRNARPLAPYYVGTTQGVLAENAGSATMKWRRYNTSADNASGISPTVTALSELTGNAAYGQGRTPATVHFTDVTATVAKYGQFFILNEEVDVFLPNGTMKGITESLAISCGRSLNYLQRDIGEENSTQVYAGNVASDGVVVSKITAASLDLVINQLTNNSAMPFNPQSNGSTNIGSAPMLPGYWGITHPNVAYDIAKMAGFKSVETYAGQVATAPGEFGAYTSAGYSVRFIQTPEASVDSDAGGTKGSTDLRGTSDVDLYTTLIYGRDAIGSVGLGESHTDGVYRGGDNKSSVQIIAKGRGTNNPSGTDDPFDEITTIAWKSWHTGAILNSNWSRAIRSGATDITN